MAEKLYATTKKTIKALPVNRNKKSFPQDVVTQKKEKERKAETKKIFSYLQKNKNTLNDILLQNLQIEKLSLEDVKKVFGLISAYIPHCCYNTTKPIFWRQNIKNYIQELNKGINLYMKSISYFEEKKPDSNKHALLNDIEYFRKLWYSQEETLSVDASLKIILMTLNRLERVKKHFQEKVEEDSNEANQFIERQLIDISNEDDKEKEKNDEKVRAEERQQLVSYIWQCIFEFENELKETARDRAKNESFFETIDEKLANRLDKNENFDKKFMEFYRENGRAPFKFTYNPDCPYDGDDIVVGGKYDAESMRESLQTELVNDNTRFFIVPNNEEKKSINKQIGKESNLYNSKEINQTPINYNQDYINNSQNKHKKSFMTSPI